jgi:putative membrane protein
MRTPKTSPPVHDNPYARFADTELILRDQLAIDRTVLANERTFLAYCRTALALILTGAGCIKFFDGALSDFAGWTLIGLGLVVQAVGVWRTSRMGHNIGTVQGRPARPATQHGHSTHRHEAESGQPGADA